MSVTSVVSGIKQRLPVSLETSIIETIAYTAQFGYPLTQAQIWQRLTVSANKKSFKQALAKVISQGKVEVQRTENGKTYYFLTSASELVNLRQQKEIFSQAKWREVAQSVRLLSWVPGLRAIFITGSLAMNNVHLDDDIDFLIVTRIGRLWLARVLVTAVALLVGKRRSWHGEEQNSWCFNLWLEEDHLAVNATRQGVYQAYEVIQAVPVWGNWQTIQRFYKENIWLKAYLPNWSFLSYRQVWVRASKRLGNIAIIRVAPARPRPFPALDQLNLLAYRFQRWYMRPHQTIERVGLGFAFFHPRDTQTQILENWQATRQHISN
jgi:hypothetical protein